MAPGQGPGPNPPPFKLLDAITVPTTSLPAGYNAYCIFVPSGMNLPYEGPLWSTLEAWGASHGQLLLVAQWAIGDPSYIQLLKVLDIVPTPAVILMDSSQISADSFFIRMDSPDLLKDLPTVQTILPIILNRLLVGDLAAAAKAATKARKSKEILRILGQIGGVMAKVKLSFSFGGATVSVGG